jgi:hypothetical protein
LRLSSRSTPCCPFACHFDRMAAFRRRFRTRPASRWLAAAAIVVVLGTPASASLMPVEELSIASWQTALGLGLLSSVFDNIPLTALALKQGGYDCGFLACAVGFGGSMIWFGSSAGVALSNMYPEAKSVGRWLRHGWHVALACVVGFFVMLALRGWNPPHRKRVGRPATCAHAIMGNSI